MAETNHTDTPELARRTEREFAEFKAFHRKLWSTTLAAVLALDMAQVTGLNHEKIDINPSGVERLHTPPAVRQGHLPDAARCIIYTSDGRFVSVLEECIEVRKRLNATK